MDKAVTPAKQHHKRKITDIYAMFDEPQRDRLLVPSRWHLSGWKYTDVDPSDAKFFNSPNRLNNMGLSPR